MRISEKVLKQKTRKDGLRFCCLTAAESGLEHNLWFLCMDQKENCEPYYLYGDAPDDAEKFTLNKSNLLDDACCRIIRYHWKNRTSDLVLINLLKAHLNGIVKERKYIGKTIGAFWIVDDEITAIPFTKRMFAKYPDAIAEPGKEFDIEKLWEAVKPKGCNKPYNYYPRGIVAITKEAKLIYANPNISRVMLMDVAREFQLGKYFIIKFDFSEEYKCYLDEE